MAQITLNIPDAQAKRVLDAVAEAYGWTPADGPKPQFVRGRIADHIKALVVGVEQARLQSAPPAIEPVDVS